MYRRQVLLTLLLTCIGVQTTIAEDEPLTIVTLGDSITKGIRTGVTADETFAQLLGKDASERYRIIMDEASEVDDLDV